MEDYFELRRYFIDLATYNVINNLNFNARIIPKNFYEDRDIDLILHRRKQIL